MQVSAKGVAFIVGHEGFVSRTYRCPAGVPTIGFGFTMASKAFADYWKAKHGRGLQMGDTITRNEAMEVLRIMLDSEYGAAVHSRLGVDQQSHHDGATSVTFNCGAGALGWKWATALKNGVVAEAARLLRTTAVTANGRRLAGLVRRRSEEAALIETGQYSNAPAGSDDVREYQQMLKQLGYDIAVDGMLGLKTKAVVMQFQAAHDLVVDGVVGSATRATLIRALDTRNGTAAAGGTGVGGMAVGGVVEASNVSVSDPASVVNLPMNALFWGVAAAVVVVAIIVFIKYRGVLTGRRVPT